MNPKPETPKAVPGAEPLRFKAVISAHTGNTFAGDLPRVADGFELQLGRATDL